MKPNNHYDLSSDTQVNILKVLKCYISEQGEEIIMSTLQSGWLVWFQSNRLSS